ncbi:hypothetical protein [Ahrensia marina]|uniref:Uncharacterized protein n=1 Tax=Ahrensia marina TaxID=1514904 RepID=A0A0M9GMQ4_9HYPH|nr:hypothetical protein [Ahrensia marina]KPB01373.1 hypothetical protein SU32_08990 [Ahrensia marina]
MATFDHPDRAQILDYLHQRRKLADRDERSIISLLKENFGLSPRESCEAIVAAREARAEAGYE